MGKEGVLLGEVDDHGAVIGLAIAYTVNVVAVIAGEHILVLGIGIDEIAECLTCLGGSVPYYAVACQAFAFVGQDASVEHVGLVCLGVVISQFGVDVAFTVLDVGGAYHMCNGCIGVII